MAQRSFQAVRLLDGHFEPLEPVELPTGAVVTPLFEERTPRRDASERSPIAAMGVRQLPELSIRKWDLGLKEPFERGDLYDEVI